MKANSAYSPPKAAQRLIVGCAILLLAGCQLTRFPGRPPTASETATVGLDHTGLAAVGTHWLDSPGEPLPEAAAVAAALLRDARQAAESGQEIAVDFYAAAALALYPQIADPDMPLDSPSFRDYEEAVAGLLKTSQQEGRFDRSQGILVRFGKRTARIGIATRGSDWDAEDIDELRLAEDYRKAKLARYWINPGVGTPVIVLREKEADEEWVVPRTPFAATALLEPVRSVGVRVATVDPVVGQLVFYDPVLSDECEVESRSLPLTRDLSAPMALASALNPHDKLVNFLTVHADGDRGGLRMVEPYRPGRIPVIFIHGLASDKFTWLDMVNDLRATPGFQQQFQVWVFQYSTGQSFLQSAQELRRALREIREDLDPDHRDPALDHIMLVGHSMGGLVSKLQVSYSEDEIWNCYIAEPLEELNLPPGDLPFETESFFFEPSPLITRVVFIGTPHQGSGWAQNFLGKLGSSLVRKPKEREAYLQQLQELNPKSAFHDSLRKGLPTSIDLLRQDSPLLAAMYYLRLAPHVRLHNIIGDGQPLLGGKPSDGVVSVASARHPNTVSELIVDEIHTDLTRHPEAVAEVKRILKIHADELPSSARPSPSQAVAERQPTP